MPPPHSTFLLPSIIITTVVNLVFLLSFPGTQACYKCPLPITIPTAGINPLPPLLGDIWVLIASFGNFRNGDPSIILRVILQLIKK